MVDNCRYNDYCVYCYLIDGKYYYIAKHTENKSCGWISRYEMDRAAALRTTARKLFKITPKDFDSRVELLWVDETPDSWYEAETIEENKIAEYWADYGKYSEGGLCINISRSRYNRKRPYEK